ncbi:hypothetical protein KY315_00985 [Candidatus Woesearchaeota archaeon]|nr:hypothetical protein [Candidatus Woesearchaeota archaeon]
MNNDRVRMIIKEEINKRLANDAFGEEFEFIVAEARLMQEFDMSSLVGSVGSFVADNLGQATVDSFKQYIITQIFNYLESVGLPITVDSILGSVMIQTLKNLKYEDVKEVISNPGSESACEGLVDVILKGLQDGLAKEAVVDRIIEQLFGPGAKLQGILGTPILNLIQIKLKEMTLELREPLVSFICNHRDISKLKDQMSKAVGLDETEPENSTSEEGSVVRIRR